jgi:hypothetical protein
MYPGYARILLSPQIISQNSTYSTHSTQVFEFSIFIFTDKSNEKYYLFTDIDRKFSPLRYQNFFVPLPILCTFT